MAIAVAKKTVVTDALKTVRQDMEQEAANEVVGLQGHDFLPVVMAIIFPAKTDPAVVNTKQAVVGNGDTMGVAAQVVEDLFGTAEGRFGVNHPLGLAKRGQVLGESLRLTKSLQGRKELQLALGKGRLQVLEEKAPEQTR